MAEYTVVLEKIRLALNESGGSRSASDLIGEVRTAISGMGEPSLRRTILDMQDRVHRDLTDIKNALTGGPGTPAGGVAHAGGGGRTGGEVDDALLQALHGINNRLSEMEREFTALSEGGHGVGGGGVTPFDITAYNARIKRIEDLITSSTGSFTSSMTTIRGLFDGWFKDGSPLIQQYIAHQKDAAFGLVNLATRSTDLILIFEKLGAFVKNQIVEKYSGYLENRSGNLSGIGYLTDEFKRIFDTMFRGRPEVGYGMVNTQEGVKNALNQGLTSPMLMYGKNIEQLSFMYRQTMESMQKSGVNVRGFGSPEQLQQLIDVLQERSKTLGPFQDMRSADQQQIQSSSLKYLGDIARYTNLSTEELIKLVKANTQSVAELEAIGLLSKKQAENLSNFLPHLQALGPAGQFMSNWMSKYIASGMDSAMFMRNNPESVQFNAMTQGKFAEALNRLSQVAIGEGSFEQKQTQMTAIARQFEPSLTNVTSNAVAAALYKDNPLMAQAGAAFRGIAGNAPGLAAPPERDFVQGIATKIEDLTRQFPLFSGAVADFLGLVGRFGIHVLEFAAAARLLGVGAGAGSMLGGALSYGGRVLGGAARFAGPILGGVGGMAAAASEGSSGAGILGAGLGGAGGAAGGAALGAALLSVAPGIGTVIGAVVGGVLGSYLGQKGGEMISPAGAAPAVSAPSNMVGPNAQDVAASIEGSRGYQDQHINILTGLLGATNQTNAILGSVYGEISRQGSSAGLSAAAPAPIGQGLSVRSDAVANPGRANAGTPYNGISY